MKYYINDRDMIVSCNKIEDYLERIGANPKRTRDGFICRCPLGGHLDRHPSFTVRQWHWHCWSHPGGVVSGTIIDLVMAVEGLTVAEAMRKLSKNL